MAHKVLIPIHGEEVATRFDHATEVKVISIDKRGDVEEEKTVVLPQASSENLCHLILTENIKTLICCAIEDEYYEFLKWKKIKIYDSVSGALKRAFQAYRDGSLSSGDILCERRIEGKKTG